MTAADIVTLHPAAAADPFGVARARLKTFLQDYALLDSLAQFDAHGDAFPFVPRQQVVPHRQAPAPELPYQNTALVVCMDGELPQALVRHFRLRPSNQVRWTNIRGMLPNLDLAGYKANHNRLDTPESEQLLRRLLPLDYALLIGRPSLPDGSAGPVQLTHMHVKIERLTDNAIRDLARSLGYVRRSLMERGEDFAEVLEGKFFEYYGASSPASGRKSAAAMAAQLLGAGSMRFAVFVAGQQDCRLTVLDESPLLRQSMLIAPARGEPLRTPAGRPLGDDALARYRIAGRRDDAFLYEAVFRRTAAGRSAGGLLREADVLQPWLELAEERLLAPPPGAEPALSVAWAADA